MCHFVIFAAFFQHYTQRFAALRGCELRNRVLSAKIKFLAKRTREFTIKFAILQNRCYKPFLFVIPVGKYFLIISCVSD